MEEFAKLIKEGAEIVGIETIRLWPQIVFVHWIEGLVELITFSVLLFAGLFYLFKFVPVAMCAGSEEEAAPYIAGIVVSALITLFTFMGLIINLSAWVAAVLAPEASYVMKLLGK